MLDPAKSASIERKERRETCNDATMGIPWQHGVFHTSQTQNVGDLRRMGIFGMLVPWGFSILEL